MEGWTRVGSRGRKRNGPRTKYEILWTVVPRTGLRVPSCPVGFSCSVSVPPPCRTSGRPSLRRDLLSAFTSRPVCVTDKWTLGVCYTTFSRKCPSNVGRLMSRSRSHSDSPSVSEVFLWPGVGPTWKMGPLSGARSRIPPTVLSG